MRSAKAYWIGFGALALAAIAGLGLWALGRMAQPAENTVDAAPVETSHEPQPAGAPVRSRARGAEPAPLIMADPPTVAVVAATQSAVVLAPAPRRTAAPRAGAADTDANNKPPILEGGGILTASYGKPVVLRASGSDPDGDNITHSWDFEACITPKDEPTHDHAVVILGKGCDQAVATLTWTDTVGAATSVTWQLLKPTPTPPPVDNRNPPPESEDEPPPREEEDGRNRTPILRGGGIVRPTGGKPVTLRVRGFDPDGDNVTHQWKLWCLEGSNLQMDQGTVVLKDDCDEGEAWLIWKDERGETNQVEWLIAR